MTETPESARLDFARAVALAGRIARQYGWPLLVMALVLHTVPLILFNFAMSFTLGPIIRLGASDPGAATFVAWTIGVTRNIVPLITLYLLTAATLRHVFAMREGRTPAIGDSLGFAIERIAPLAGLAVLVFVGSLAGLILLIVPGLFIWVAWLAAAPVLVMERGSINSAVERSLALTRDSRWALFLMSFLFFGALLAIGTGIRLGGVMWLPGVFKAAPDAFGAWIFVGLQALETGFAVLAAAGLTAIYIQLRGFDAGHDVTAEVFD